jgi:putative restriction endonuclease
VSKAWSRHEVLAALHLYTQLSFGQLHQRNADIQALAEQLNRTPSSVAMKLTNLASLDPQITASGRKGLPGASALDREIWAQLMAHWDEIALQAAHAYATFMGDSEEPASTENTTPLFGEGKTTNRWVQVRTNQAWFRKAVLNSYKQRCCISGLAEPRLLVASHIVPWREDSANRLNPQNGLCLSVFHDKAFDLGLITVTPEFKVVASPLLKAQSDNPLVMDGLLRYDGCPIAMPERFGPRKEFLAWHGKHFGFHS